MIYPYIYGALAASYWPDGPGVNMFLSNKIQKKERKKESKAAMTSAAAGHHTGFSADNIGERSFKCSAEMTVKMSTLDLQATLPRFSTNPISRAKSLTLTSATL